MKPEWSNSFAAGFGERTVAVEDLGQSWGALMTGHGFNHDELCVGSRSFSDGFGGHAPGAFRLTPPVPVTRLHCLVGVDRNAESLAAAEACPPRFSRLRFHFYGDGRLLYSTPELTIHDEALPVELDLERVRELEFRVESAAIHMPHAAWAQIRLVGVDGAHFAVGMAELPWKFELLPIAMQIGGEDFSSWCRNRECDSAVSGAWTEYRVGDFGTGLVASVQLRQFSGFDAVEWRVFLENQGATPTPLVQSCRSLDLTLTPASYGLLHRAIGAYTTPAPGPAAFSESFRPITELLSPGERRNFGPRHGRPSSEAMPYWNVFVPERQFGMVFGIGWAGQWNTEVEIESETCRIQAGNPEFAAVLEPGERIELPSILAIFYRGDTHWPGQNGLRRVLREKFSPPGLVPPLSNIGWGGMTENMQLNRVDYLARHRTELPFELFWIDAGWFGPATAPGTRTDESSGAWASVTGDWRYNRTLLPEGFANIAAAVHAVGMKFMVWLEPERAVAMVPAVQEHPEWFLGDPSQGNRLLDLGCPEAWQYAFDTLDHFIRAAGLDVLRIDCNIDPLAYWQDREPPQRRGVREVRYVAGLYRLWQALGDAHPGLWIDNCCSGGRRLDYRLGRYGIALWASDSQCHEGVTAEQVLQQGAGLAQWLPNFGFGTQNPDGGDTANFRCAMNAALAVHLHSTENHPALDSHYPADWLAARLTEYRRFRHYMAADYYLPEGLDWNGTGWIVQQFDCPEEGGVIRIFRRPGSPYGTASIALRGLVAEQGYEWEDGDTGTSGCATGANLSTTGLAIVMPEPGECKLIFYQRSCKK